MCEAFRRAMSIASIQDGMPGRSWPTCQSTSRTPRRERRVFEGKIIVGGGRCKGAARQETSSNTIRRANKWLGVKSLPEPPRARGPTPRKSLHRRFGRKADHRADAGRVDWKSSNAFFPTAARHQSHRQAPRAIRSSTQVFDRAKLMQTQLRSGSKCHVTVKGRMENRFRLRCTCPLCNRSLERCRTVASISLHYAS